MTAVVHLHLTRTLRNVRTRNRDGTGDDAPRGLQRGWRLYQAVCSARITSLMCGNMWATLHGAGHSFIPR